MQNNKLTFDGNAYRIELSSGVVYEGSTTNLIAHFAVDTITICDLATKLHIPIMSSRANILEIDGEVKTFEQAQVLIEDALSSAGGASSADKVSYDNTNSGLQSTNVQGAIDEIGANLGEYESKVDSLIDRADLVSVQAENVGYQNGQGISNVKEALKYISNKSVVSIDVDFSDDSIPNTLISPTDGTLRTYTNFTTSKKYTLKDIDKIVVNAYMGNSWLTWAIYSENDILLQKSQTHSPSSVISEEITTFTQGADYIRFSEANSKMSQFSIQLNYIPKGKLEEVEDEINELKTLSNTHKVVWYDYTMTSSGYIYENPLIQHSEYLDAYSVFVKETLYFRKEQKAYLFFDENLQVVGSYQPSQHEMKEICGELPNIPQNARYVVFNQTKSIFKDLICEQRQPINTAFTGKDVLYFGDSFFDQEKLTKAINNILGCNGINRGVSGSIVASKGGNSYQSLVDRLDGFNGSTEKSGALPTSCDMIIINCSTNDWGTDVPLGEIEDGWSNKNTFVGGVHYVVKKLHERYGNTPIVWIAPTHRQTSGKEEFIFSQDGVLSERKNADNHTLKDYYNALKDICNMYSIRFVDVYSEGRICPLYEDLTTSDKIHPTDYGAKLIALKLRETIRYMI